MGISVCRQFGKQQSCVCRSLASISEWVGGRRICLLSFSGTWSLNEPTGLRHDRMTTNLSIYRMFNLKVDRQLSREYFTSEATYNGSAGLTYMCRNWQDCCRRWENLSWPSVSVESVDSECWSLNSIFYAFIMRLTVKERVFILESYPITMSYAHCKQSFFEKFRMQAPVKSAIAKMIKK